jgi:hypothetical protein
MLTIASSQLMYNTKKNNTILKRKKRSRSYWIHAFVTASGLGLGEEAWRPGAAGRHLSVGSRRGSRRGAPMRIRAAQPVPCVEADTEGVRDAGGVMCGFGLSIAVWVLDGWI